MANEEGSLSTLISPLGDVSDIEEDSTRESGGSYEENRRSIPKLELGPAQYAVLGVVGVGTIAFAYWFSEVALIICGAELRMHFIGF